MFPCDNCEKPTSIYNYKDKKMVCSECGHEQDVKPYKTKCFSCGEPYLEYTWFDPSGCDKCNRSFID